MGELMPGMKAQQMAGSCFLSGRLPAELNQSCNLAAFVTDFLYAMLYFYMANRGPEPSGFTFFAPKQLAAQSHPVDSIRGAIK